MPGGATDGPTHSPRRARAEGATVDGRGVPYLDPNDVTATTNLGDALSKPSMDSLRGAGMLNGQLIRRIMDHLRTKLGDTPVYTVSQEAMDRIGLWYSVAMPTAMPSAPLRRRFGILPGKTAGSFSVASKLSNAKPSGSIFRWHAAHVGFVACASSCMRMVAFGELDGVGSSGSTFGGGMLGRGGGLGARATSWARVRPCCTAFSSFCRPWRISPLIPDHCSRD